MKRYEILALIVAVLLMVVLLLVLGTAECVAGNCTSHKWQQSTTDSCTCWYKKCDGKCTRAGTWNGDALTCACPVIGTCGESGADPAPVSSPVPTPVSTPVPTVVIYGPTPTPTAFRVELTSDVKICYWYPGLDTLPDLVEGEIRREPATGILWKCMADGTTVKLLDGNLPVEETLTHDEQPWPGGFLGCLRTYGVGWRLNKSKGLCIKYVITKP